MRIAVVSDIHANLTALDAVIADVRKTGADLVVCGGDLMSGGPRPAEVIDRVREMTWPGVYGNTDEMLWMPHRVSETLQAPQLHRIRDLVPERRLAIYVDGARFHVGANLRRDTFIRDRLRKGTPPWRVEELRAQHLGEGAGLVHRLMATHGSIEV